MRPWSLRRRLTLAVVTVVAAVVVALAVVVLALVERAAWRQFDGGLRQRAQAWSALVEHDTDGYELELPPPAPGARATYDELWCPADRVLARSPSLGTADLPRPTLDRARALTLPDGRAGRAFAFGFVPRQESDAVPAPCTLVVAEGTEDVTSAIGGVRRWFVLLSALAIVLAAALTAWLIGRGLVPLVRLGEQLEAIDGDTLATRIELAAPPQELAAPVATLNQLLARLDAAFARERQFTADVSHELRTPLAGLRVLLEVAELTATTPEAWRATGARAVGIVVELTQLVEHLLALARADGGLVVAVSAVPARALIDAAWVDHADAAAARGLRFTNHVDGAVELVTDRALATMMVGNLLANAAAYTEIGGWIEVRGDARSLAVIDSGPSIPVAHLPRLFDRLWRGDSTRTATGAHAGIGLALVHVLCGCLGSTVTAANRDDGAVVFTLAFGSPPKRSSAPVR